MCTVNEVVLDFKSMPIFCVHDIIPKDPTQKIFLFVISHQAHLIDLSAIGYDTSFHMFYHTESKDL